MKLPQLALRDLFWLVLVAAILSCWWRDRCLLKQEITSRQDEISAHLEEMKLAVQREVAMAMGELAVEQAAHRRTGGGLRSPLPHELLP